MELDILHHCNLLLLVQAPVSMKAMCLAVGCISIGLGDLIVVIVAESDFFQNRVSNIVGLLWLP